MTLLLENILEQPDALRSVGEYQTAKGRDALERSAALLRQRKRIVVSGMGASFCACIGFAYALSSVGIHAQAIEASELLYFLDSEVDAETTLVLVSRSGESVETTKLLRRIGGRGVAVIGVVNVEESTLRKETDQAILIASPPDEMVAIQTYTGTVAMFGLLAAILSGEFETAVEELRQTGDLLSRWIPECVGKRESLDSFLKLSGPCYLLGRGSSLASIQEGVLLMHETAKTPAVGMSVAQFRHGPVEAVDDQFHAVMLGTQPDTASLEAALANDVTAMKGTVRWLGPAVPECAVTAVCAWPDGIPMRFRALAEIVPLQILAYRKAELNGIRPGEFRWAPLVTTSEAGFGRG